MVIDRYIRICFIAADPEAVLTSLTADGIELTEITRLDALTVEIRIRNNEYRNVVHKFEKMEVQMRVVRKEGILWMFHKIYRRPVLLVGIFIFLLLGIFLSGRILLIDVEGCVNVSEKAIIHQAEITGVRLGAKTSELRSEDIKNKLLENIPQLQWVGVTTFGSKVTIHIRERSNIEKKMNDYIGVSSVVASRDGMITEMTVYQGNPQFQIGDTVKAGDVIISGYTDCGYKILTQQALGEIFAFTQRKCSFITPSFAVKRNTEQKEHICYRLRIGKKVINFCNHSGISEGTCVRMYSEYYWSFPGGTQLPLSITKIKTIDFDTIPVRANDETKQWLLEYAREYLRAQMISGKIVNEIVLWNANDDVYELSGTYACHEMIGQEKQEEIIVEDAKDN